MKKTIWKITCQKRGNKVVYYEPQKLPEWAKRNLCNKEWEVTERRVFVKVELAKTYFAKVKYGCQDTVEEFVQKRISDINNAANGKGSLLS